MVVAPVEVAARGEDEELLDVELFGEEDNDEEGEDALSEHPVAEAPEASPDDLLDPAEIVEGDNDPVCEECETEVQKVRIAPTPWLPTRSEVEYHRCTHIPFRTWCKFCRMAKGLGEKRPDKEE